MYHINPQKGPKICRARQGNCPYGVDAPHFETFEEAMENFNSHLSNLNVINKKDVGGGVSNTVYKPLFHYTSKRNIFTNELKKLDDTLASSDLTEMEDYMISHGVYDDVRRLVGARLFKSMTDRERLNKINPRGGLAGAEVSEKVYKELLNNHNSYNNHTGMLMDALNSHPKSLNSLKKLDRDVKVGGALMINSHNISSNPYIKNKEIIGLMALKEYSNNFKPFDQLKLDALMSGDVPYGDYNTPLKTTGGAIYRNNVMERFALIDYAKNTSLKVYDNEKYYSNIKDPTQVVRPLAFISSEENTTGKPDGILEIVKCKNLGEIPIKDKANILYSLETLEFDKAFVRGVNGDNKYFDTVINRSDELASGVKMKEFINKNFKSLNDGGK